MVLDMPYFRRNALWMAVLATGVVFILWNIPQLSFILYPFRLFVTFVHEAGHALMASFTGGGVESFTVIANGTGWTKTWGGNRVLILAAGYLGAAFFGAALFYLVNTVPFPRKIALALKLLSIRAALRWGADYIRTNNDSQNAPMLAINRKLGYVPQPGGYRMVKALVEGEK